MFTPIIEDYTVFFKNALLHNNPLFTDVDISLRNNIGGYDSIVISSKQTTYRPPIENSMIARIKLNSKKPYISFKSKYEFWFKNNHIPTYSIRSDLGFFRVELSHFQTVAQENIYSEFCNLLCDIYIDALKFPSFGCCDRFKQCSDQKHCVHDDLLYSTACMYRKNLERGKILYGKNKNV